jgi:hypothetical protein
MFVVVSLSDSFDTIRVLFLFCDNVSFDTALAFEFVSVFAFSVDALWLESVSLAGSFATALVFDSGSVVVLVAEVFVLELE